jgi:putative redox protein
MTDSSTLLDTAPKRMIASLDWTGGLRFTAGKIGGPVIALDGDGEMAPSPVVALLCAAGACSGADVVSIIEKKRINLTRCHVEVGGDRREDYPRRFTAIWLRFTLAGEGLTEAAARQAVDLSVEKYCSVMLSLNPDITVRTEIVIES